MTPLAPLRLVDNEPDEALAAVLSAQRLAGKRPMRTEVYDLLRKAIVSRQVPVGERLVEAKIAEWLGISRTPVREALHKLELERLVVPRGGRGFVVRGISPREIDEMFDLRMLLEPEAVSRAAEVIDLARRRRLEKLAAAGRKYLEAGSYDAERTVDLVEGFYRELLGACPNQLLGSTVMQYRERLAYLDRMELGLGMYSPEHRQAAVESLLVIAEAVRDGRTDDVARLARERITRGHAMARERLHGQHGRP